MVETSRCAWRHEDNLAPSTASINSSSCGRVSFLRGAIRDFTITGNVSDPFVTYATAL